MISADVYLTQLTRRFLLHGGVGPCTNLIEHLPSQTQECLARRAPLRNGELPAIASVTDDEHWVLITTERVIRHDNGIQLSIEHSEIKSYEMELQRRWQRLSSSQKIDKNVVGNMKRTQTEIQPELHSGANFSIRVEAGTPYFGIVNVIRLIIQADHSGRQHSSL